MYTARVLRRRRRQYAPVWESIGATGVEVVDTYQAVAGPKQFLRRIKGKSRYGCGRMVRSWRRQLHECKLCIHQSLFTAQCIVWMSWTHWWGIPRPSPPPYWQHVHRYYVPVTRCRHASDTCVILQKASCGVVSEVEATRRVDACR